jgi:hypothetical protein
MKEYKNTKGEYHRTDGPAIEWKNGVKEYWVNGVSYPYLPTAEEILTREIIE